MTASPIYFRTSPPLPMTPGTTRSKKALRSSMILSSGSSSVSRLRNRALVMEGTGRDEKGAIWIIWSAHTRPDRRRAECEGVWKMARKPKFTRAQIKNHIKKIQDAMEKHKREHEQRGEHFRSLSPEEIEKKLKRVNSPILVGEGWSSTTPPGGTSTSLSTFITRMQRWPSSCMCTSGSARG